MKNAFEVNEEKVANIINKRSMITQPGKYRVTCGNVTPYSRQITETMAQSHIVNLNAMTEYHVREAINYLGQGDYQEALNMKMTYSLLEGQDVPMRGETVDIMVEEITTSNGITGLFVTNLVTVTPTKPTNVNLNTFVKKGSAIVTKEEITEAPY
jgi:hypothetical protein